MGLHCALPSIGLHGWVHFGPFLRPTIHSQARLGARQAGCQRVAPKNRFQHPETFILSFKIFFSCLQKKDL